VQSRSKFREHSSFLLVETIFFFQIATYDLWFLLLLEISIFHLWITLLFTIHRSQSPSKGSISRSPVSASRYVRYSSKTLRSPWNPRGKSMETLSFYHGIHWEHGHLLGWC
jgi:hypothetical protein